MPHQPPWQTWRKSFLGVVRSAFGPQTVLAVQPAAIRRHAHGAALPRRQMSSTRPKSPETDIRPDQLGKEIRERVRELDKSQIQPYPRYAKDSTRYKSLSSFIRAYDHLERGKLEEYGDAVEVHGRIHSIRNAGSRLSFIDIIESGNLKLQVLLNHCQLAEKGIDRTAFTQLRRLMRRGDVISVTGYPHRTQSGQLSIRAQQLPQLLSPCLHQFPVVDHGPAPVLQAETQPLERHVEMHMNRDIVQTLVRRSKIIRLMRDFFQQRDFLEVETPILAASAGGATARAFQTTAAEFPDRRLSLRIAPELWLKKLIVGGMEKIFEIGPSFRNEGLDKTHNPEFTTCEFYSTYTSLPELLSTTESLLELISQRSSSASELGLERWLTEIRPLVQEQPKDFYRGPYSRIDFIPALSAALQFELPSLASNSARADMFAIFDQKGIALPANATLPRLLDKLSSTYLEPECQEPTWIINIPECLSPLSKSFVHPTAPNEQPVAARAELFIHGKEIVNCYEEENDPFEQRRKFQMQQLYARSSDGVIDDNEVMPVDEDYLKALEWGLPPTGGWGCGIDRLVMLMCGKERIADVLSFGGLRAVTRGAEKVVKSAEIGKATTDSNGYS